MLFLSKAHNLNNFLQSRTMLRVWADLSESHKVHRIFGIIVGFETTSHAFFHILRWAVRKNDIHVSEKVHCTMGRYNCTDTVFLIF